MNATQDREANGIEGVQSQVQPIPLTPNPTVAVHAYRLGHQAYSQGDAQAAYGHFQVATQTDLACVQAHRWLGRVATELGLGSEAKQAFETLIRLQGYSAALGQGLEYADEISRFGLEAASQFRAGCEAQQHSRLEAASIAFGRAVAVQPSHHRAWARLGQILLDLKSYDGAVIACERALALEPHDAGSAFRLRLASQHTASRLPSAGVALEVLVEDNRAGHVLHGRR
jgi:tetratricopeptide (TPR) repeat protein